MSLNLRIALLVIAIAFMAEVLRLVSKRRLQLKYSLLWLALSLILILCAVFPGLVSALAKLFGIQTPSNMVFLVGIIGLLGIALSLTVIVSWQSRDIRFLLQEIALLHKRLDENEKSKTQESQKNQTTTK